MNSTISNDIEIISESIGKSSETSMPSISPYNMTMEPSSEMSRMPSSVPTSLPLSVQGANGSNPPSSESSSGSSISESSSPSTVSSMLPSSAKGILSLHKLHLKYQVASPLHHLVLWQPPS